MGRQIVYILVGAIVLAFIGAAMGLVTGMNIGGNYYPTFQLGTMVGYEATGMIGLLIGGALGAVGGGFLGRSIAKRKS